MLHESLADQVRRIGRISALAVVTAAALGTFALLDRVIAIRPAAAPHAIHRVTLTQSVTPTSSPESGGSDPIAASQLQTEQALNRGQRQQATIASRQAAAIRREMKGLARKRFKGP